MQKRFTNSREAIILQSMLLSFSCENYGSILDSVELSVVATTESNLQDTLLSYSNVNANRVSLIYGPNGSGKTTILDALYSMMENVILSNKNDPDDEIEGYKPHKLSTLDYSSAEIYFVKNDIKYYYGYKYNASEILEESLYYSPNGRLSEIFSRNGLEIHFAERFRKYEQNVQNGALKKNKLLLSVAASNTDSTEILTAYDFFRNDLFFCNSRRMDMNNESSVVLAENPKMKGEFIDLFNRFGFDIEDIIIKKKKLSLDDFPEFLREDKEFRKDFEKNPFAINTEFKNPLFSVDLIDESSGTRALYGFINYLIKALHEDIVLICDEIESSLHSEIVRKVIEIIQKNKGSNSQLICSTHDINLLDQNLVRRDQIFLTEKTHDKRATSLYCLSEVRNVRNTENLRSNYLSGKYGGLPSFPEEIEEGNSDSER